MLASCPARRRARRGRAKAERAAGDGGLTTDRWLIGARRDAVVSVETEVKYRFGHPVEHDRLRAGLVELGAEARPIRHELNLRFDTSKGKLKRQGRVLRLRLVEGTATLTLKGPARRRGGLKTREEVELEVPDVDAGLAVLAGLGYLLVAAYAKRREPWWIDGVEVTLDTLEVGWFCELEGAAAAIAAVASRLGLADREPEERSYAELAGRRADPIDLGRLRDALAAS
ncbi:MAG TPA: class IV adenylate cyclase [Chloroflexota bacterium]